MNIGDGSGRGEDHCELVGGSELTASTGFTYSFQSVNGMNYPLFSSMCFIELTLTSLYSRLWRNNRLMSLRLLKLCWSVYFSLFCFVTTYPSTTRFISLFDIKKDACCCFHHRNIYHIIQLIDR